jgi:hypothetical protein
LRRREVYSLTVKLGRVIARRELTRGRGKRPVAVVEIGQPRKTKGHDDFYCPYRIRGVGDETVRAAYGGDAVQALQLVSQGVAAHLFRHPDLTWLGMPGNGFPPADESLPMEWARAVDATSTAPADEPVEPPGVWPPLEFYVSTDRPRRVFFFTKVWLPRIWLRTDRYPARTDAIVHYGMPSRLQCELLRTHARSTGSPLRFVGDLDPLDLAVFRSLQAGGAPLRARAAPAVPVAYAGIDDEWLRICERRLEGRPLATVCIRQDATERRLLAQLVKGGVDLDALVGPSCGGLLRDGLKLEIEGASSAGIYGKDFMRELLPRLLRPLPRR